MSISAASDPRFDTMNEREDTQGYTQGDIVEDTKETLKKKKKKKSAVVAPATEQDLIAMTDYNKSYITFAKELKQLHDQVLEIPARDRSTSRMTLKNMKDRSYRFWEDMIPVPRETPYFYDFEVDTKSKKIRADFFKNYGIVTPILLCSTYVTEDIKQEKNVNVPGSIKTLAGNLMQMYGLDESDIIHIRSQAINSLMFEKACKSASRVNEFLVNYFILYSALNQLALNPLIYFHVYKNLFPGMDIENANMTSIEFLTGIHEVSFSKFDVLFGYDLEEETVEAKKEVAVCAKIIRGHFFTEVFKNKYPFYIPKNSYILRVLSCYLCSVLRCDIHRIRKLIRFFDEYQSLYGLPTITHYSDEFEPHIIQRPVGGDEEIVEVQRPRSIEIEVHPYYIEATSRINDKKGYLIPFLTDKRREFTRIPDNIVKIGDLQNGVTSKTYIFTYEDGARLACREIMNRFDLAFLFTYYQDDNTEDEYNHPLWCLIQTKLVLSGGNKAYIMPHKIDCYNCTFYDLQLFVHISHQISSSDIGAYDVMDKNQTYPLEEID